MSPTVKNPSASCDSSVFALSPLYSKSPAPIFIHTVPGSPAGTALPSSSVIFSSDDRPRAPDRAGVLQPLVGRRDRAAAFGGPVVLPDHRAPPVEHLALHVDRAGRRGVDRPPHRRHVVLALHVVGQLQHAMELRRHHVRVRAPVALDEPQRLLGVPLVHAHDRVLHVQRVARERRDRGVVVRRRAEVHVAVAGRDAEQAEKNVNSSALTSGSMSSSGASRPWACRSCPTCSASPRRWRGRRAASSAAGRPRRRTTRKPGTCRARGALSAGMPASSAAAATTSA